MASFGVRESFLLCTADSRWLRMFVWELKGCLVFFCFITITMYNMTGQKPKCALTEFHLPCEYSSPWALWSLMFDFFFKFNVIAYIINRYIYSNCNMHFWKAWHLNLWVVLSLYFTLGVRFQHKWRLDLQEDCHRHHPDGTGVAYSLYQCKNRWMGTKTARQEAFQRSKGIRTKMNGEGAGCQAKEHGPCLEVRRPKEPRVARLIPWKST